MLFSSKLVLGLDNNQNKGSESEGENLTVAAVWPDSLMTRLVPRDGPSHKSLQTGAGAASRSYINSDQVFELACCPDAKELMWLICRKMSAAAGSGETVGSQASSFSRSLQVHQDSPPVVCGRHRL